MLRIGMVDSFAATIGPHLIKSLLSSAVHLHVASGLWPGLGDALIQRRLDMIVTTDSPEGAATLERHRLLSERYVLLLPRALADLHPAATIESLTALAPLVRFNIDSNMGLTIEHYLGETGVVPPHRLEIDTADSLVAMVAAGIGWALITPLCLLHARADPQAVTVRPLPGSVIGRALILLSRRDEYGGLPETIAATATDIFTREWRPQLARFAPWLVDAVAVG